MTKKNNSNIRAYKNSWGKHLQSLKGKQLRGFFHIELLKVIESYKCLKVVIKDNWRGIDLVIGIGDFGNYRDDRCITKNGSNFYPCLGLETKPEGRGIGYLHNNLRKGIGDVSEYGTIYDNDFPLSFILLNLSYEKARKTMKRTIEKDNILILYNVEEGRFYVYLPDFETPIKFEEYLEILIFSKLEKIKENKGLEYYRKLLN